MKRWLCLCILLLLTSCDTKDVHFSSLKETLMKANEVQIRNGKYYKPFYSYYVDPSIGRISSNTFSNTFNYQGMEFTMEINASSIIAKKYYEEKESDLYGFNDDLLVVEEKGTFMNNRGEESDYDVKIYNFDGQYLTLFHTEYLDFYGIGEASLAIDVAGEMLKIAKSVTIDENAVVTNYSIKDEITYQTEYLELFENRIPESGSIMELLKDDNHLNEDGKK